MVQDAILSTGNPRKGIEAKDVFAGSRFRILTLREVGIEGGALEDGATLTQNAFKKASFARERYQREAWILADDTELTIPALGGAPGVHTARWAGEHASARDLAQHCLDQMWGVRDRRATFRTVVAAISPAGTLFTFEGCVEGYLFETMPPRVLPDAPLGSLFVPRGHNCTLAEMPIAEENAISHRGQAFRKLRAFLEQDTNPQYLS